MDVAGVTDVVGVSGGFRGGASGARAPYPQRFASRLNKSSGAPPSSTPLDPPLGVTDLVGVTDIVDVTDDVGFTDDAGVTDITDVTNITDVAGVTDVTDITDVAGVTDITGGTGRHMAYSGPI